MGTAIRETVCTSLRDARAILQVHERQAQRRPYYKPRDARATLQVHVRKPPGVNQNPPLSVSMPLRADVFNPCEVYRRARFAASMLGLGCRQATSHCTRKQAPCTQPHIVRKKRQPQMPISKQRFAKIINARRSKRPLYYHHPTFMSKIARSLEDSCNCSKSFCFSLQQNTSCMCPG